MPSDHQIDKVEAMSGKRHEFICPVGSSLEIFAGRWKPEIIWHLRQRDMRFNELLRAIGTVSQKMLTQQLREMERDGLVQRTKYPEVPPRVEYKATDLALSLELLFEDIASWGTSHATEIAEARKKYVEKHSS